MKVLSPVDVAELGRQFDGVQFSANSSLYVPTLHEVSDHGGSAVLKADSQEFHVAPSDMIRFMLQLRKYPSVFSVQTHWGEGKIGIDDHGGDDCVDMVLDVQKVADMQQESLRLELNASFDPLPCDPMSQILNGDRSYYADAEFIYTLGAQFCVRQFAQMRKPKNESANDTTGIAAMAIAFGSELLRRVADIKYQGQDGWAAEGWKDIGDSVRTGGITHTTPLLAACFVDGDVEIPLVKAGTEYTISTVECAAEVYRPQNRPQRPTATDEAVATFSFVPKGGFSPVFGNKVNSPVLEVCQTVPMTLHEGPHPYAPILASGLIAASLMSPTFPLASLVRA